MKSDVAFIAFDHDPVPLIKNWLEKNESKVSSSRASAKIETTRNFVGQTALHFAILDPVLLKRLLAIGADPDTPDQSGTTPLMYAATYNNPSSAKLLVDFGADIERRDQLNNRNFIDYALRRRSWSVVAETVQSLRGEDVNCPAAAWILNYCLVAYLKLTPRRSLYDSWLSDACSLGANPDVGTYAGNSCMHFITDSREGFQLLKAGFSAVNRQNEQGTTPIMKVAKIADFRLLNELLLKGAAINDRDKAGCTFFHYFVNSLSSDASSYTLTLQEGDHRHDYMMRTMNLALSRGADPTMSDNSVCLCSEQGRSPLALFLGDLVLNRPFFGFNTSHVWMIDWYLSLTRYGCLEYIKSSLRNIVWFRIFTGFQRKHACTMLCEPAFHYRDFTSNDTKRQSRIKTQMQATVHDYLSSIRSLHKEMKIWESHRHNDYEVEWVKQIAKVLDAIGYRLAAKPKAELQFHKVFYLPF